ncbi:MAG: prolipoprotein diacylglyceryl transferase [Acidobacteria bacterium]|nr:prolipoprotein diacylglyceryl transferase [Acidobacteriota bacterium]
MHPKLLETPYFTLHTYGVILAVAYLCAYLWLSRSAQREGINRERIAGLALWAIIGAILGAKLLLILRMAPYYLEHPSAFWSFSTLQSGGDFYGGFVGALVSSIIYLGRHRELSRWKIADLCGPAIALGQGIGRIGCFMAGCCYGRPTGLPWGVAYTDPAAAEIVGTPLGIPLHPTQAYESLTCFALFFFLVRLSGRKRFEGQVILAYSILYAILRFLIEFARGDADRGFILDGLLSTSQFVALIVLAAGLPIYVFRWNNSRSGE